MRKLTLFLTLIAAIALALANAGCSASTKKIYHAQRGDHYFNSGHYDQAEVEYLNVLRSDSGNAHAYAQLGIIYYQEGRLQRAAPFLAKGSELDTNNAVLRLKLGQIYLALGRAQDARGEAEAVLDKDPRNPEAPMLLAEAIPSSQIALARQQLLQLSQNADSAPLETALGMLAAREHDLKTAEKDFKRALAVDPDSADAYSAYGNLLWTQNNLKDAESAFKKASDLSQPRAPQRLQYAQFEMQAGKTDDAKKLLQQMTVETPDYVPAWLGLAQMALSDKNFDDSEAALNNALARDGENFNALLMKGQLDLARGKTATAIQELERLSGTYPQAPRLRYELALAYFANAESDKTRTQLNTAISLDPDFAEATFLLAEIEIKDGNADSAEALLRGFIKRRPELVQAKLLLADACRVEGNFNDAQDVYRQLETASPNNPEISLLIGSTYLEQKDDDDARKEFTRAEQLEPNNPTPVEELTEVDLLEKQFPAAIQRANDLIQKNPALPDGHVLLAKIFLAEHQTNQCEAELSRAIDLQPRDQLPFLLLAQLQFDTGEYQKSVETLNAALKHNPADTATLMLAGQVESAGKNDAAAAGIYERLLVVDPGCVPALNNLACIDAKDPATLDRAYELAQRARQLRPTDPSIEDTMGWVLFKKGQFMAAEKLLQECAGQLPNVPDAQYHYGMAAYMQDDEQAARDAFQHALQPGNGSFSESGECSRCLAILAIDPKNATSQDRASLEKRIADMPADPVALTRLVSIYQNNGLSARALPICEAALQANPQSVKAMVLLAQQDMDSQPAKAFDLAKAAYQLKPDDLEVDQTLGWAAYQNHSYQWSYNLLQQVSQSQPNNPQTFFEFAKAAFSVGKLSDALTAMNTAIQGGLSGAEAAEAKNFTTLIPLVENPGQATAAESQVQDILATNPDYPPALLAEGVIDSQKGDSTGAETAYEKVLGRYPDFAPAQKNLAILYAQNLDDPDKAYSLAVKAREMFPDDPDVARALGLIVFEKGDYARAANVLDAISDSKSADAELFYCLGISEYHLRNFAASRSSLERALSMNLAGQQASDARETLAELK
ncbi:MAG TPA: tetratricopeptide repeat protein [Verrucomicrobiae bacterium]|jgi:tetratricopeptide (TPR) repeat protein